MIYFEWTLIAIIVAGAVLWLATRLLPASVLVRLRLAPGGSCGTSNTSCGTKGCDGGCH